MSKVVAFLLANQFEDSEMKEPYDAVIKAGHKAIIIGLKKGEILKGKKGQSTYTTDQAIADSKIVDYDAIVIPGGSSPEALRLNSDILEFVKEANDKKLPIAAICHGPQILISAALLNGRTITSYQALQDDVVNAGAKFKDEEVVVDGNFITSRTPEDEPAFIRELLKVL
jgi:protease I